METKDFDKLGNECIEHLTALNPKGGIKVFMRMAVEFGYNNAVKNLTIPVVIQRAFEYMSENKAIELSEKGKIELDKCWENSSAHKWEIQAIWVHDKITICSEYHCIFNEAPMDWFEWHVA